MVNGYEGFSDNDILSLLWSTVGKKLVKSF